MRVIAVHTTDGSLELFHRFCSDWEMWTAEVMESHTSYPMLALFRSQHAGQSWITALGVVTDAAVLACACIEGEDVREPYFLYRRGRRAVGDIAAALNITDRAGGHVGTDEGERRGRVGRAQRARARDSRRR